MAELQRWGLSSVCGDAYAGQTFRADFQEFGVSYRVSDKNASELYEQFEPMLNQGEIELLDIQKLQDQFLGLIIKGSKIKHLSGEHDDFANAAAGALTLCKLRRGFNITSEMLARASEVTPFAPSVRAGMARPSIGWRPPGAPSRDVGVFDVNGPHSMISKKYTGNGWGPC